MNTHQYVCNEKRGRMRAAFDSDAVITAQTGEQLNGVLNNVSLSGMYIRTGNALPVRSQCNVDVAFLGKNSSLKISVSGQVVRTDDSGVGIQFDSHLEWWTLFPIFASYLTVSNGGTAEIAGV